MVEAEALCRPCASASSLVLDRHHWHYRGIQSTFASTISPGPLLHFPKFSAYILRARKEDVTLYTIPLRGSHVATCIFCWLSIWHLVWLASKSSLTAALLTGKPAHIMTPQVLHEMLQLGHGPSLLASHRLLILQQRCYLEFGFHRYSPSTSSVVPQVWSSWLPPKYSWLKPLLLIISATL